MKGALLYACMQKRPGHRNVQVAFPVDQNLSQLSNFTVLRALPEWLLLCLLSAVRSPNMIEPAANAVDPVWFLRLFRCCFTGCRNNNRLLIGINVSAEFC